MKVLLSGLLSLVSSVAFAGAGVTLQGQLLTPSGTPVTSSSVQFRLQVRSPGAENCLLYEEQQAKDLSASDGVFVLTLNDGTATVVNTEPFTLARVFQNRGTFAVGAGKCTSSSTYSPNPTDGRRLFVEFNDGSFVGWEALPTQMIGFTPMAMESLTVGGYGADSFLRVADASGTPALISPLTLTQHNTLLDLVNGTSGLYRQSSASVPAASISGTVASGQIADAAVTDAKIAGVAGSKVSGNIAGNAAGFTGSLVGDVTGLQGATVVVKIQGRSVSSAAPTNGQTLIWNTSSGAWEPANLATGGTGTVTSVATDSSLSGGPITATGTLGIAANGVTTSHLASLAVTDQKIAGMSVDKVVSSSGKYLTYKPNNSPCADGGVLKWNNTDGRWDCGIDAGSAGTLASITVSSPLAKSGTASDPTLSIADASAFAKGVVQLATSSGTAAGLVVQANDTRLTDARVPTGTASGDLAGNYPSPTIAKLQGEDVTLTALANGNVLKYDGTKWVNATDADSLGGLSCTNGEVALYASGGWSCVAVSTVSSGNSIVRRDGTGMITSAGGNFGTLQVNNGTSTLTLATPAAFTSYTLKLPSGTGTNGQILTSNGTDMVWSNLSISPSNFAPQTQSTVLAAPSGGNGTPTFRALAAADIPALDMAKITTGTLGLAQGGTGATTQAGAANAILPSQASANGKALVSNGTNVSWGTVLTAPAGSNTQIQFNSAGALGAASTFVWDNANSRLGVGTNVPSSTLHVFSGSSSNPTMVAGNNASGAPLRLETMSGTTNLYPVSSGTSDFRFPAGAGTAGDVLVSQGNGSETKWGRPRLTVRKETGTGTLNNVATNTDVVIFTGTVAITVNSFAPGVSGQILYVMKKSSTGKITFINAYSSGSTGKIFAPYNSWTDFSNSEGSTWTRPAYSFIYLTTGDGVDADGWYYWTSSYSP